jgi:hypothetical protein
LLGKWAENVEQLDKRGEPPAGKASRSTLLGMLYQQDVRKRLGNRRAQGSRNWSKAADGSAQA